MSGGDAWNQPSGRTARHPAVPDAGLHGWRIYRGTGQPHDGIRRLPAPPEWRRFDGGPPVGPVLDRGDTDRARRLGRRGRTYRADDHEIDMVNAALYLRRPLLVTGKPGIGKSTLAYSVAEELRLGPVLHWPITSRSTLQHGLYEYDAIGRLQEASLARAAAPGGQQPGWPPPEVPPAAPSRGASPDPSWADIGRYIQLGPLGTALLPSERPRVLLVDELDKSDVDLPSDLLHVFEEGEFAIRELTRLPEEQEVVEVLTADGTGRAPVRRGHVRCRAFPVVIVTSNGERQFQPAFQRRCLHLDLTAPDHDRLASIVEAQAGPEALAASVQLIEEFLQRRERGTLATDQLLNAVYVSMSGYRPPAEARDRVREALLRDLDATSGF